MKISLVLATVARTDEVGRCLRSLAAQTDPNFEVLVVDQNPDECLVPFVQAARNDGMAVTHLRMATPSLSGARNLGIQHAIGDVIGLTDDDCWYEPDAIENLRATFLADPGLQGTVAQWVEQHAARGGNLPQGALSLDAWRRYRGGDASSITLFFKRELFLALGGFDERFGIGQWFGAAEEIDFVLRSLESGTRITYSPRVRVRHHFGTAPPGFSLASWQSARRRARGTGGIYAKHRLAPWIVVRGLVAPFVTPLFHGKLIGAAGGAFVSLGRLEGFLRWKRKEAV